MSRFVVLPCAAVQIALLALSASLASAQQRRPTEKLHSHPQDASSPIVTGFVGSPTGVSGSSGDGGPASKALLFGAYGIIFDSNGNMLISDYYRGEIREVDGKTGIITRIAGTEPGTLQTCTYTPGPFCGDGGPALSAYLVGPLGMAFDGNGNLYFADSNNSAIRRIDAKTQVITTVAGISMCSNGICTANAGYTGDNGPATAAQLNFPYSVAVDGSGDIYIADEGNRVVREIVASSGNIVTVPITVNSCCSFNPYWVEMDGSGNLLISDSDGDNAIWQYNPTTTKIVALAGVGGTPDDTQFCPQQIDIYGDGCLATQAELLDPLGFAYDANGNLYIADGYFIREVDAMTGIINVAVGNGTPGLSGNGGPPTEAQVDTPWALAFDATGNFYFADSVNNEVREVNFSGNTTPNVAAPTFSLPIGAYNSPQSIVISDLTPNAIIYYTTDGSVPTIYSPQYSTAIKVAATTTINAFAIAPNYDPSVVASAFYLIAKATTTTLSSSANPAKAGTLVVFSAAVQPVTGTGTPTGTVAFMVDGKLTSTAPLSGAGKAAFQTAALAVGTHTIVATYSGDSNFAASNASLKETIVSAGTTAAPKFAPAAGTYAPGQLVKISDATAGAVIYYTTNGSTPTKSSTKYSKAIAVRATETIKAIAVAPGLAASTGASAKYTILPAAATPTFSVRAGTYKSPQAVKIADTTKNATIYYTVNGTVPTTSSKKYMKALVVSKNETIEAIAIAPGHSKSAVAKAVYIIK
ncbi:MAG: chitobiase/beta-hexosaminidase C-terminal domain-containing protein [Terracidiphilus sp.]